MKLHIKGEFSPITIDDARIDIAAQNPNNKFILDGKQISIMHGDFFMTVQNEIEIDQSKVSYLSDLEKSIPRDESIEDLFLSLSVTAEKVYSYLKYFYGIREIDDRLRMNKRFFWSLDANHWNFLPDKTMYSWRPVGRVYELPDNLLPQFWSHFEDKVPSFTGLFHLHVAFNSPSTRIKWINATVAAELAFKEFLTLFDKRTASLMAYVPSPPLKILYKDVLMDFTKTSSPFYKELHKGAEKRNELIHRPEASPPEAQITDKYLRTVEAAILHLYILLYPGNSMFAYYFELSKSRLSR